LTPAILDSTVILHIFRKYKPAVAWFKGDERYWVTSITWMEVMVGVTNKRAQVETLDLLDRFETLYVTQADQERAMQQVERFQFSHHIGMNDCLIAAVAYRMQVPLYTHNLKDMTPMLGALAIQPYT
jgi:predicted nucleic acid-binding protein